MSFALTFIVKVTIIFLCAALSAALLRRASASLRCAIWVLAITSAVLLPLMSAFVPQLEWPVLPDGRASVAFLLVRNSEATGAHLEQDLKPATTNERAWPAMIWLLGVSLLFVRLTIGAVVVLRIAKRSVPSPEATWQDLVKELSGALHIARPVRLLFSCKHVSPITWGVLRHTILLPSTAEEWPDERRRLVLAHELAHVKRNDGLIQIFVQVVSSVYWFNPIVWYAAHRIRIERERACDDCVLNLGTAPADYADHLVQIARGLRTNRAFATAAVSMAQPSQLETRLVSILDFRVRRQALSRCGSVLLCSLAALMTLSLSAIGITAATPLPPVSIISARFVPPVLPPEPTLEATASPQRTRIGNGEVIPNNAVTPPHVLESSRPEYTNEAVLANVERAVIDRAYNFELRGLQHPLRGGASRLTFYALEQQEAQSAALSWWLIRMSEKGTRRHLASFMIWFRSGMSLAAGDDCRDLMYA